MVDIFHEKFVIEEDDFRAKNVQLDLAGDRNEAQLNSEIVPMT
jgi:hypothetical protein